MSDQKPIDPMAFLQNAIAQAHTQNELVAATARIKQLEERLKGMREAGDALWYCIRHAQRIHPEELIDAVQDWQEARNNG